MINSLLAPRGDGKHLCLYFGVAPYLCRKGGEEDGMEECTSYDGTLDAGSCRLYWGWIGRGGLEI